MPRVFAPSAAVPLSACPPLLPVLSVPRASQRRRVCARLHHDHDAAPAGAEEVATAAAAPVVRRIEYFLVDGSHRVLATQLHIDETIAETAANEHDADVQRRVTSGVGSVLVTPPPPPVPRQLVSQTRTHPIPPTINLALRTSLVQADTTAPTAPTAVFIRLALSQRAIRRVCRAVAQCAEAECGSERDDTSTAATAADALRRQDARCQAAISGGRTERRRQRRLIQSLIALVSATSMADLTVVGVAAAAQHCVLLHASVQHRLLVGGDYDRNWRRIVRATHFAATSPQIERTAADDAQVNAIASAIRGRENKVSLRCIIVVNAATAALDVHPRWPLWSRKLRAISDGADIIHVRSASAIEQNGTLRDVIIVVDDRTLPAHIATLSTQQWTHIVISQPTTMHNAQTMQILAPMTSRPHCQLAVVHAPSHDDDVTTLCIQCPHMTVEQSLLTAFPQIELHIAVLGIRLQTHSAHADGCHIRIGKHRVRRLTDTHNGRGTLDDH